MSTNTNLITNLLHLSKKVVEIENEISEGIPFHINLIDIIIDSRLKEISHSAILHRLLCNPDILKSFVGSIIGLPTKTIKTKAIRPREKDHMDISIYDDEICIIIENKINDAKEQTGQLFRYVEEARKKYCDSNIYILYLTSDHIYKPSDKSLTRNGDGRERMTSAIEDRIIIKDFKHDIYNWIKDLSSLDLKNEILNSAILQYKDYLEELFKMKPEKKKLKDYTRREIERLLLQDKPDMDNPDYIELITTIQSHINTLDSLIPELKQYKAILKTKQYREAIDKVLSPSHVRLIDLNFMDLDELGIKLKSTPSNIYFTYGYDSTKSEYYIGIYAQADKTESIFKDIQNIWNNQFKDNDWKPEANWPFLKYVNESQLITIYSDMALEFHKNSMLETVSDLNSMK